MTPAATEAQTVPTQQALAGRPQTAPAAAQTGPAASPLAPSSVQTPRPGGPAQVPAQQSSGATHPAPRGAHALRQVNPPRGSGRQRPPQHCASTRQGLPSAAHPPPSGRQRSRAEESARQVVPAQQSPAFMHSSPTVRHAGILSGAFAQRPTSWGPAVHTPEQHSDAAPQRSCSGWQPGRRWQRLGPETPGGGGSQRPEQQSLSVMHRDSAGPQPGRD